MTNPEVGIVIESQRAVEEEVEQARGVLYPELDVRIAHGIEWVTDPSTRARERDNFHDDDVTRLPRSEVGITLRQLLFDGFAAIREVERQKRRVQSSQRRVRETSELIALDAIEAYLESLRQRELVALSSSNVRTHETHLNLVRSKVAGGASSQADVEQAESRLASARDNLAEAEGRLIDADTTYKRVVGEEADGLSRPQAPAAALPQTLDAVVGTAVDLNPTVRVFRADLAVAEKAYEASTAPYYPRFDLELATNRTDNVGGTRGSDTDGSAMVVMTYNLFRGGRDAARRRELCHRVAEARQRLHRQLRLTEEEARLSWNALQNARLRLQALRAEVQANDRVRNTYRQQFDIGQRSLLDLLDSENELFIAKTNAITSEFVEYFGIYRILAATGTLLNTMEIAPPTDAYMDNDDPIGGSPNPGMHDAGYGQPTLTQPQAPYTQPIKPTYVAPQDRMAPMGRPVAPRAAPQNQPSMPQKKQQGGAPEPGDGSPVLDPNAPVLDPNAPTNTMAPGLPPLPPPPEYRDAALPGQAQPYRQAGIRQQRQATHNLARQTRPLDPRLTPPNLQQVPSRYETRTARDMESPITRNAPIQLTSRERVVAPLPSAAPVPQPAAPSVADNRSSATSTSYWGF
jgi:adhesin transport system outer membrane protein